MFATAADDYARQMFDEEPLMKDEERTLVCEGKCNPGLFDYDVSCRQWVFMQNRSPRSPLRKFVLDASRNLKHTMHRLVRNWHWDETTKGWVRSWRCVECQHTRRF